MTTEFDQETKEWFETERKEVLEMLEELTQVVKTFTCTKDRSDSNRLPPGRILVLKGHIRIQLDEYKQRNWLKRSEKAEKETKRLGDLIKKNPDILSFGRERRVN